MINGVVWFFVILWIFPERMLGVMALAGYLFIWLPWDLLSLSLHLTLFAIYLSIKVPKVTAFREARFWDWLRKTCYPVTHIDAYGIVDEEAKGTAPLSIYAIAPHGIYGEGVHIGMSLDKRFSRVTLVGSSIMTWLPIVKDICNLCGMIAARKQDIVNELVFNGNSILIVPEGIRGILCEDCPEKVPPRLGFIECAVEAGARIVPVYMPNVWDMYIKWPSNKQSWFRRVQHAMLSSPLKYCFLFCWGAGGGFFPLFRPVTIVYGKPIQCEKISPYGDDNYRFNAMVKNIAMEYCAEQATLGHEYKLKKQQK